MPLRSISRSPLRALKRLSKTESPPRRRAFKKLYEDQNRPGRSSMLCTPPATLRPVWPCTLSG
jgi:hypothetical protein